MHAFISTTFCLAGFEPVFLIHMTNYVASFEQKKHALNVDCSKRFWKQKKLSKDTS
jgi:hypothetical protein